MDPPSSKLECSLRFWKLGAWGAGMRSAWPDRGGGPFGLGCVCVNRALPSSPDSRLAASWGARGERGRGGVCQPVPRAERILDFMRWIKGTFAEFCKQTIFGQHRFGVTDVTCRPLLRNQKSVSHMMLAPSSDHPPPPTIRFPKTQQVRCLKLSLLFHGSSRFAGCPLSLLFGWAADLIGVTLPAGCALPQVCGLLATFGRGSHEAACPACGDAGVFLIVRAWRRGEGRGNPL